jgi:hypothetical protein
MAIDSRQIRPFRSFIGESFNAFLIEKIAELKIKIEKLDDGRFLVMKWSERGKFYPDGKPFKTEKEAKEKMQSLKLSSLAYDRISKAWKKAHSNVPIRKFPSNEYPVRILQAIKSEMNKEFKKEGFGQKGPFTEAQLRRALFDMTHALESWDYLSGIIVGRKKMRGKK